MPSKELGVYLTGLEGKDDNVDLLMHLFEESQTLTVETASPMLDLISFAQDCREFWVIVADEIPASGEAPLSERPPEELTNSLGRDYTPAESSTVDPGRQHRFSNYLDTVLAPTPNSSTDATLQHMSRDPSTLSPPSALYTEDDCRRTLNENVAGFIYLLPSSAYPDALHFEEYNIGIILCPEWRNKGVAQRALHLALDHVFSQRDVHRVQAQLIDCYKNAQALTLFTRMGFSHEGTRRQGFYCPLTAEWKDVTTLALLVTDWVIKVRNRNGFQSAFRSLWDALFGRHQREREELMRWEDRRPVRTPSLETIRDGAATPVPSTPREVDTSDSEGAAASDSTRSVERSKRKLFEIGNSADASDAYDASSSECESEYESAVEGNPPKKIRSRSGGPTSATTSAESAAIDWSTVKLGSLFGKMRTSGNEMGEGHSPDFTHSLISFQNELVVPSIGPPPGDHESPGGEVRSPSFSPEPREGSVATTPPSEFESEFELEDGYTSTSSSSPSGWELLNNDDEA